MTTSTKSPVKRKTIAVLCGQYSRAWGAEFMAGVMDTAEAGDVNVVCFVGGRSVAGAESAHENSSSGLYNLAFRDQFDGFILASDVGFGLTPQETEKFCKYFLNVPVVSYAVQAPGVSAFIADNTGGMRSVIRHLIEVHKYKRIAFIRGLDGQVEAEARFEAYKSELKAHKIDFDKNLVVDGDYSPESGRAAVRVLMDERKIRFDAVAAANDRMAFGAMEALQQRGVKVPDSVALTGFDDVREAQSLGVPLTTVYQSFYGAGRRVFQALMNRIEGETIEAVTILPTQLVVRWSCGCLPKSVSGLVVLPKDVAHTGRLENKRESAIRALFGAGEIPENDRHADQFRDVFGRTWDVFLASLQESNSDAFLKMVQIMIETLQRYGRETTAWNNIISTFRKYALGGISSTTTMLRAENLFQQMRMLAGELSQRAQAYRRLQLQQQEEILGRFSFSMAPAMSLEEIGEAISKHFPAMGVERWYVMFYSDINPPDSDSSPTEIYRLMLQYDQNNFEIPKERSPIAPGRLVPLGKTPEDRRYSAIVMPLALARNRFGFMWTEVGPSDPDVYVRVRNLVSSALLRTTLVQQREQAQKEVERLLVEARERALELDSARDWAEKAAAQNAKLFGSEQTRRSGAEALARSSRQLSSLTTVEKLPQKILDQLTQILPHERSVLVMEDVNSRPRVCAHRGLPDHAPASEFSLRANNADFYETVSRKGETLLITDVKNTPGWKQPDWLPSDQSWMGVPLYLKDNVVGMLALSRSTSTFDGDDGLLVSTFGMQASIALQNSRLYDEITTFNQMMERMVEQRVAELNAAYMNLEKHDKNKSTFIQVAAHELRTPLTVIKGYLGMLKGDPAISDNPTLLQAIDGVMQGTNRLQQVVTSMLDAARLDNQVVSPHIEAVVLSPILHLIQKGYVDDLTNRQLTLNLDASIRTLPPLMADPELLKKALDHVIVNAIKFTPDGGSITVTASVVGDERLGACGEIRVMDTGIGIDPANHKIIFEKLHQLGKVELHSSSRTNFKGGGAGLGLAIAAGIVKALQGSVWVESPGHDEENLPGSTFFIRIPLVRES
jgi:signal transduction histidine kinase/DNA-binding LacI/PurR family transcriptional regulator